MDYDTFCAKITELGDIDFVSKEEYDQFCQEPVSFHIRLFMGKMDEDGFIHPTPVLHDGSITVLDTIELLKSRGAERRRDFIVISGENSFGDVYLELHVRNHFISVEDLPI